MDLNKAILLLEEEDKHIVFLLSMLELKTINMKIVLVANFKK